MKIKVQGVNKKDVVNFTSSPHPPASFLIEQDVSNRMPYTINPLSGLIPITS